MAKMTDYGSVTRFDSGDIIIKDGSAGTKKMAVSHAAVEFAGLVSAIQHRNVFRGKNLGSEITDAQKAAIADGSFDDLFIGDYWTINEVNWVIADMDYWYRHGNVDYMSKHHLVIIPKSTLYNCPMDDSNTTEGGYVGSKMYTEYLDQAKTAYSDAFGDMLLTHREHLVNGVTDSIPSSTAWFDSTVDLMNEIMVYGCNIVSAPTRTNSKEQLALFRLNPTAFGRVSFWLRDVVSGTKFAYANNFGGAFDSYASTNGGIGVRPAAAIG